MKPYDKSWVVSNFHRSMYQTDKSGDKVWREVNFDFKSEFQKLVASLQLRLSQKRLVERVTFSFDHRGCSQISFR